jgi:hypothetical protein
VAAFCRKFLFTLGLGAVLLFLAQSTLYYAELAGLVPCVEGTEQHQECCEDQSSSHCCHTHCQGAAMTGRGLRLQAISLQEKMSLNADTIVPEAPVRDIEHPPQLS